MALPMNLRIGMRGEQLVAQYLREKKYYMLGSGFATKLGETDVIAFDEKKRILMFVEVKTRSPGALLPPSEAVDREKQNRLLNNAAAFIKCTDIPYKKIRFDIAEVILYDFYTADINYIEDAFGQDMFADKK